MFNVTLAGGHLYGKRRFTWLSLVDGVFCAVLFFSLDVLAEIWDLIVSVSEGFLTYSLLEIISHDYLSLFFLPFYGKQDTEILSERAVTPPTKIQLIVHCSNK